VDVWSIGVIFFEMLYGKKPFGHGLSQQKILHSEVILRANHIDFPSKSPKNYKITDEAKDFIRKCLEYDADKRLSSQEAYDHEYTN
jgi:tousled-like kinase